MNRTLAILSVFIAVILTSAPLGYSASAGANNILYTVNPLTVQVSQGETISDNIPFCRSGGLICYSPAFIRSAYNFPTTLDGSGQTIVIVDAFGSPTIEHDLAVFDRAFGLAAPPSFQILCDPQGCPSFNPLNAPQAQVSWTFETTLDVEWAHAMAPGANIVLSVASTPFGDAINVAEARAISLFPGSVISQSFGIPEGFITGNNAQVLQAERNYAQAASEGTTVLASAGDSGASNGFSFANANFPASSPLVTGVGGTMGNPYRPSFPCTASSCSAGLALYDNSTGACKLHTRAFSGSCPPAGYGGEQVWNEILRGTPIATGGAPSLIFAAPDYQTACACTGSAARTTPDVSYNGAVNGGVLAFYSAIPSIAGFYVFGGTSAGSPQWAAIFAIANQARALSGKGPLGFVNPALYTIAQSSSYASDFHDITTGSNALSGTTIGFAAGTGYDLASGWGTPNVANLVADLT